jgi:hypothetical protein
MTHPVMAAQAEQQAEIAEQVAREAVSKQRADALGPVEKYPRQLAWWPNNFGVTIEVDGSQWIIGANAPIMPGHLIRRLIRDEFNQGLLGSC